jgi:membrane-bound lytic murein transglycosylase D
MPEDDFVALNPAYNKPVAVVPTGTLVLPLDKAEAFRENLENWDQPLVTWNTIQGKKGESVYAIAKRYGLSGAALKQVNNLHVNKKGRLTASQPILVPGHGTARTKVAVAAAPAKPAPSAAAAPARAAPARTTSFYTVKAGDTLYGIARQFGRGIPDLMRLNNLSTRAIIQPGLRLRVY